MPGVSLSPHWLGEPTLHPEFARLVRHAFAANAGNALFRHFKIHTNASILPDSRAALLVELAARSDPAPDTFRAVHFSVDAHSAEAYAPVKGRDCREQVYPNVTRFLELCAVRGQVWPRAHGAIVVQEGNAHEVVDFVENGSAVLAGLGDDRDAIYLRRLNAGSQPATDALHARACAEVGIASGARVAGELLGGGLRGNSGLQGGPDGGPHGPGQRLRSRRRRVQRVSEPRAALRAPGRENGHVGQGGMCRHRHLPDDGVSRGRRA